MSYGYTPVRTTLSPGWAGLAKPRVLATGQLRRLPQPRIPQTQKTVLRARAEPGEERVNLFGNSKKRIGVGVGEMLFQELDPEAST